MDCVVAVLHNETIENFQHFGSLIGSDSVCLGDLESNMVFQCETVLFESITEQAQMMAWTGRLLKIKSKDGCHPLLFWFTNPTACL